MKDKSLINTLTEWWRSRPNDAGQAVRTCPLGHPMDPNWTTCPRCAAEQRARDKTVADRPEVALQQASPQRRTIVQDADPDSATAQGQNARPRERKIIGVLVTYSRRPQGQLFAVYEGRNVIGSGTVESEGYRPCDVQIRDDPALSNEHAIILCRSGHYDLIDSNSTNGTWLNETFVGSEAVTLPDAARIRAGDTVFIFRMIDDGQPSPARAPDRVLDKTPGKNDPG